MSFLLHFKPAVQSPLAPGTGSVGDSVCPDAAGLGEVLQMTHLLLCGRVPGLPTGLHRHRSSAPGVGAPGLNQLLAGVHFPTFLLAANTPLFTNIITYLDLSLLGIWFVSNCK